MVGRCLTGICVVVSSGTGPMIIAVCEALTCYLNDQTFLCDTVGLCYALHSCMAP
jgi:hypothetical protein